jgi:hypothetical protein
MSSIQLKGTANYKGVRLRNRSYLFTNHPIVEFARKRAYSEEQARGVALYLLRISPERGSPNAGQLLELEIGRNRAYLANSANLDDLNNKEIMDLLINWRADIFDIDRWERSVVYAH